MTQLFPTPTADKNPMVCAYGITEGKRCKHCVFCFKKQFANNYYKCEFRGNTAGPKTDHRVNWNACGKFQDKTDPQQIELFMQRYKHYGIKSNTAMRGNIIFFVRKDDALIVALSVLQILSLPSQNTDVMKEKINKQMAFSIVDGRIITLHELSKIILGL